MKQKVLLYFTYKIFLSERIVVLKVFILKVTRRPWFSLVRIISVIAAAVVGGRVREGAGEM